MGVALEIAGRIKVIGELIGNAAIGDVFECERHLFGNMIAQRQRRGREVIDIDALAEAARRTAGHRFPAGGEFGRIRALGTVIILVDILII